LNNLKIYLYLYIQILFKDSIRICILNTNDLKYVFKHVFWNIWKVFLTKIPPPLLVTVTANLYVLHFFFANLKYLSKKNIRCSSLLILRTKCVRKIISFWENGVHSIAYLTAVISCRHLLRLKLWFRFRLKIWNAISGVSDFVHTCRHPFTDHHTSPFTSRFISGLNPDTQFVMFISQKLRFTVGNSMLKKVV